MNIKAALITAGIVLGLVGMIALAAAFPVVVIGAFLGIGICGAIFCIYLAISEVIE